MNIVFSLLSALSAGTSDFLGGLGSRRAPAVVITTVSQGMGVVFAVVFALVVGGDPVATDLWWGAVGGVGGGLGLLSIYQGYAKASVAVAAPLAGVGTAALPVVVDVASGQELSRLTVVGVVLGLVSIALVSMQHTGVEAPLSASLLYGAGGALGLGLLLLCLGQASDDGGVWPVAPARLTGFLCVGTYLAVGRLRDRTAAPRPILRSPATGLGVLPVVVAVGLLGTGANGLYVAATQRGSVTTAAVITAMFPAVTVVWARTVFGEHLRPVQVLGLLLAVVAIGLIAGG